MNAWSHSIQITAEEFLTAMEIAAGNKLFIVKLDDHWYSGVDRGAVAFRIALAKVFRSEMAQDGRQYFMQTSPTGLHTLYLSVVDAYEDTFNFYGPHKNFILDRRACFKLADELQGRTAHGSASHAGGRL